MTTKEFIEKYCLVNGKNIKLTDYQIAFINRLETWKKKRKN